MQSRKRSIIEVVSANGSDLFITFLIAGFFQLKFDIPFQYTLSGIVVGQILSLTKNYYMRRWFNINGG